jgi:hypothetical protein
MTIIERMYSIVEKMQPEEGRNRGISLSRMENASTDIDELATALGISRMQALMITVIVRKSYRNEIDERELAQTLDIDYLQFLMYHQDLVSLQRSGYIRMNKKGGIKLPRRVLDGLLENRPVEADPRTGLGAIDLLIRIKSWLSMLEDDLGSPDEMIDDIDELMNLNPDNSVSKTVRKTIRNIEGYERIVLYGLIYRYYFEDDDMVGWHDLDAYLPERDYSYLKMEYKLERLSLQALGIIEYAGRNSMMSKDYFKLSDDIKEQLFADVGGIRKEEKKVSASRELKATEIISKTLFYNPAEGQQVSRLKEILSAERLDEIRSKMKEKGLRSGFTCLFYGGPGTGKTETVYQIAKASGRNLFIVDVSQIKSCWVGESEKNIKKVFDKYREAVKAGGIIPILLFNEADAVFGIRREGADGAVDKMENSVQNIILQEMEDLDGILIATTNLTTNLDKAFERRFLYKIRFEKPSSEARSSIWRAMLPSLSVTEADFLAGDFDFSGGQIENIVRKSEVQSILDSSEPGFDDIRAFCSEEIIGDGTGRKRIGF